LTPDPIDVSGRTGLVDPGLDPDPAAQVSGTRPIDPGSPRLADIPAAPG
jgi:hypothetical protein